MKWLFNSNFLLLIFNFTKRTSFHTKSASILIYFATSSLLDSFDCLNFPSETKDTQNCLLTSSLVPESHSCITLHSILWINLKWCLHLKEPNKPLKAGFGTGLSARNITTINLLCLYTNTENTTLSFHDTFCFQIFILLNYFLPGFGLYHMAKCKKAQNYPYLQSKWVSKQHQHHMPEK